MPSLPPCAPAPPGTNRPTPPWKAKVAACHPRVGLALAARTTTSSHHGTGSLPFHPPAISAQAQLARRSGRPPPTAPPLGLRAPSPNPPRAQPQPKQRKALPSLLGSFPDPAPPPRSAPLPCPLSSPARSDAPPRGRQVNKSRTPINLLNRHY
ncbi:hypothetical protein GQ55_1G105700 [Panicum hallii var. hallii]|uniref:Uncharacterized protein n=1 Tax=Panicum hallii var. hallii TaxID=1504633 RepID=A0A2T7F4B8_9POAL|nr:hypothetical protein GQ55_1G105700 [Panicum hallii var. hallii]